MKAEELMEQVRATQKRYSVIIKRLQDIENQGDSSNQEDIEDLLKQKAECQNFVSGVWQLVNQFYC